MSGQTRVESQTEAAELITRLAGLALSRPESEREAYLRSACGSNSELLGEAWKYVQCQKRTKGHLLDPLYSGTGFDYPFEPGQLLISRFRILRKVAHGGMGIV